MAVGYGLSWIYEIKTILLHESLAVIIEAALTRMSIDKNMCYADQSYLLIRIGLFLWDVVDKCTMQVHPPAQFCGGSKLPPPDVGSTKLGLGETASRTR